MTSSAKLAELALTLAETMYVSPEHVAGAMRQEFVGRLETFAEYDGLRLESAYARCMVRTRIEGDDREVSRIAADLLRSVVTGRP